MPFLTRACAGLVANKGAHITPTHTIALRRIRSSLCARWCASCPQALKQFHAVVKHFDDIHEDQFDFHSYCVRKTTLRAYVGMLRMEDKLYGHPFFARAAVGAVKVYLALLDKPSAAQQVGCRPACECLWV